MWYRYKFSHNSFVIVYHGTKTEPGLGQISGYYPGLYTSIVKDDAKLHGENLYHMSIDLNKIYKLEGNKSEDNLKQIAAKNGFGYHSGNGNSEAEYLKSIGFYGMSRGTEIILFDNAPANFEKESSALGE